MNVGIVLAIIGMALAVGMAGLGSIYGVGISVEAAMGVLSEDPSKFGKLLVLSLLPGTQGLYGFIVAFLMMTGSGVLGGGVDISWQTGLTYLVASLPIAIGGFFSARAQGRAAVAGISLVAKRPGEFGKAMVSTTLVEIYALLSLLISLLTVVNIK